MAEQTLLRMMQISDLHIGEPDAQGNAAVSPRLDRALSHLPFLDGLLGHHHRALSDLVDAVERERQVPGPELLVAQTGDLTRCGALGEHTLASQFLRSAVQLLPAPPGALPPIGLGLTDAKLSISGNHDQWGGINAPWGLRPSRHQQSRYGARPQPWLLRHGLGQGLWLLLMGIDTDADVARAGRRRMLARGHFVSQLDALRQRLQRMLKPSPGELRVLLLHHAVGHRGNTLAISDDSRWHLRRLVEDLGIRIVLTGHTHGFRTQPVRSLSGHKVAHEFGCGTTSAADTVKAQWSSAVRHAFGNASLPPNVLLMHTLVRSDQGALLWRCLPHFRDNLNGFVAAGQTAEVVV